MKTLVKFLFLIFPFVMNAQLQTNATLIKDEDRIIALDKIYKAKGYPVIAINPNDLLFNHKTILQRCRQDLRKKDLHFHI